MERDYKIIAIDFDGTLFETDYPAIVRPILPVIEMVKARREKGDKLILWTCREGPELDAAVEACRAEGLEFDAVNDNIQELKDYWKNNPRKVAADEYWDDKNSWCFVVRDQYDRKWIVIDDAERIKRFERPIKFTDIHGGMRKQ